MDNETKYERKLRLGKEYRARNKEKVAELYHEWYVNNKAVKKAYHKKRREENLELYKAKARAYYWRKKAEKEMLIQTKPKKQLSKWLLEDK